jgi:hypothetical protein
VIVAADWYQAMYAGRFHDFCRELKARPFLSAGKEMVIIPFKQASSSPLLQAYIRPLPTSLRLEQWSAETITESAAFCICHLLHHEPRYIYLGAEVPNAGGAFVYAYPLVHFDEDLLVPTEQRASLPILVIDFHPHGNVRIHQGYHNQHIVVLFWRRPPFSI